MNLRQLILSAALLLGAGCTTDEEPAIRLTDAFIPDDQCAEPDFHATGTSVDISIHSSALVAFKYDSDDVGGTLSSNGQVLAEPSRNDIIIEEREISYENEAGIDLATDISPLYMYAESTADGGFVVVDLLTTQAAQALAAAIPNPGDSVQVVARFKLRGKRSVGGPTIETREVKFPISVYRSNFTCPAGQRLVRNGPCGTVGGQGGAPLECEAVQ